MSIYAIADLHLSFETDKPMNIFGENWDRYEEKLKQDWMAKVEETDTVLLLGDFSWALNLSDTYKDFEYINNLPGRKILLKGNHDYWWGTLNKVKKYLEENNFKNIDFLQNNSYLIEDNLIVGTRGWSNSGTSEENKIQRREMIRLDLSIQDGIKKYGNDKPIILCTHYPPYSCKEKNTLFDELRNYNVKVWLYGHLHGKAHQEAVQETLGGIKCKLISSDYTEFKLIKVV